MIESAVANLAGDFTWMNGSSQSSGYVVMHSTQLLIARCFSTTRNAGEPGNVLATLASITKTSWTVGNLATRCTFK
eukprot:8012353-Lingulodinium_polyedra.AAC.1